MNLLQEEFEHPTQVSRVRLRVFPLPEGFLVTEERQGVTTVFRPTSRANPRIGQRHHAGGRSYLPLNRD